MKLRGGSSKRTTKLTNLQLGRLERKKKVKTQITKIKNKSVTLLLILQ